MVYHQLLFASIPRVAEATSITCMLKIVSYMYFILASGFASMKDSIFFVMYLSAFIIHNSHRHIHGSAILKIIAS